MTRLWKRLSSSAYLRDTAMLSFGTGVGQAIILTASPVLTRIYTPEDFGVLALFASSQALLMLLVTGKFEQAIILERSHQRAWSLCQLVVGLGGMICMILTPLLWWHMEEISILLGRPQLKIWLPWLPISSWLGGMALAGYFWALRLKRFRRAGSSEIASRAVQIGTSLGLGVMPVVGAPGGGLVIALSVYQAAKAGFTLSLRPVGWSGRTLRGLTHRVSEMFQRHWRLCFSLIGSQGLSVVANMILVFALGALYGDSRLGLYALATRMVSMPSLLISNALGDVYRQRAAELYRNVGHFDDLMFATLKKTVGLAIAPYGLAIVIAPWLFAFVFGEAWREAGEYARILLVSGFFSFVITPLDKAAVIVGAKAYILGWHSIRLAVIAATFAIAWYLNLGIYKILWALAAVQIFLYLIDLGYEWVLARGPRWKQQKLEAG